MILGKAMFEFFNMPLTVDNVKQQKAQLKQIELENFAQSDINFLISNRTLAYDKLLVELWKQFGFEQIQDLALIAVGGYGRKEMFPLSDIDFLILSKYTLPTVLAEKISEYIQFLWDCGFEVGASVRTLAECDVEGRNEITIATNLLESRFLCGNESLHCELSHLLQAPDFWKKEDFYNAKIQEKIERYQRYNNTSYNLEPDIKYSPGGLRDLHLIYWIALRHFNVLNLEDIFQTGFIYPEEFEELEKHQQFLFKVRFALHLIIKRYDNRLLFEFQVKVSQLLGYQGEGNQGVEAMMKDFFQSLQAISLASDILAKHYKEHFLQPMITHQRDVLDEHFEIVNNSLYLHNQTCLMEKTESILDLFAHLIEHPKIDIHSNTLRQLHLALGQLTGYLCEIPAAREKFLAILTKPKAVERALIPMHKYGVLTAYIPAWKGIEGLMQFDLFHIYTVDEHTMRLLSKLESFLDDSSMESHPICAYTFPKLPDRSLIYIAALFHDIAKGRGGDHAELGALEVAQFAVQHGFNGREIDTMKWLVKKHLLMPITAQRRDIHDPEVIMRFAEDVKNQVRLDYLICLTVADICATNVALWNSWKRSLFTSLYHYTKEQFKQGMDSLRDSKEHAQYNAKLALEILHNQGINENIQELWARCPEEYFLRNTPQELAWHANLLLGVDSQIVVKVSNRFSSGGTGIFIYCKDQPSLFYKVACVISNKKLSIHDAQIMTSLDGYAFDTFIVTEIDGSLLNFDRRRKLEKSIVEVLKSNDLPKLQGINNHRLQHFYVTTEVRFLNTIKNTHTEMELYALDKTGLLADVSRIFSEHNLNIQNAKITTVGEKVEDFFILTNAENKALTEQQRFLLSQQLKAELS